MPLKKTILGLLHKLTSDYQYLSWQIACSYSDGISHNIYTISIAEHKPPFKKRRITFCLEDGRVMNCQYKFILNYQEVHIVDVLLDIINFEKA